MRKNHRVVMVAAAFLLLSGCATTPSAAPAPVATSSTPSPTAATPSIATIAVGGAALQFLDADGDTVAEPVEFTADPAAAIAILTGVFGSEPVVTTRPSDESCTPEATEVTWADGVVVRYGLPEGFIPPAQSFEIEVTTASVGEIGLESSTGVAVGGPVEALTATLPPEQVGQVSDIGGMSRQWVDYHVASGSWVPETDPDYGSFDYWGATARVSDGVVDRLSAPTLFVNLC